MSEGYQGFAPGLPNVWCNFGGSSVKDLPSSDSGSNAPNPSGQFIHFPPSQGLTKRTVGRARMKRYPDLNRWQTRAWGIAPKASKHLVESRIRRCGI